MKNICKNINLIRETLKSSGRLSETVEIIAVTKTFPAEDVSEALKCGIKDIGESKIQEALPKFLQLGEELKGIKKHFIGHLQSNKAKKAVENFDLIHSLDSINLAKDINRHAQNIQKIQHCLIEVKVSDESTKTGVDPEAVRDFYSQCKHLPNILIKGLMVITPLSDNPEDSRPHFRNVHKIFKELQKQNGTPEFDTLSMGMSDDFKIAAEEGSTMVRIGSAIFGERDYGNK